MTIRLATAADLDAIVAIKQRLSFVGRAPNGCSIRGGFLLGCDREGYLQRLQAGRVWVLTDASDRELSGFAISLYPSALQASPLWSLGQQVQWADAEPFDVHAVSYFDQLAVLPEAGHRAAVRLAHRAFVDLLPHSEHVLATTVSAPVKNLAAVPLIERVGGVRVGQLAETYPEVGALTSDLWLIDAARARLQLSSSAQRLNRTLTRIAVAAS